MTPLIQSDKLGKKYPSGGFGRGCHTVFDDVDWVIYPGETVALVGDSGCGKSTLAKVLLGLDRAYSGDVFWNGKNIKSLTYPELRRQRAKFQMIFQDATASLHPLMTVREIFQEVRGIVAKYEFDLPLKHDEELLAMVGLADWCLNRYPRELSGGQRQRVAIARSLVVNPALIVADEPTSNLDAPIKNQVLNALDQVRKKTATSILLISHEMPVVRCLADRVVEM